MFKRLRTKFGVVPVQMRHMKMLREEEEVSAKEKSTGFVVQCKFVFKKTCYTNEARRYMNINSTNMYDSLYVLIALQIISLTLQ